METNRSEAQDEVAESELNNVVGAMGPGAEVASFTAGGTTIGAVIGGICGGGIGAVPGGMIGGCVGYVAGSVVVIFSGDAPSGGGEAMV